jgi:PAS domain S-box-containing protein
MKPRSKGTLSLARPERNRYFRLAVESSPSAMVMVDREGKIVLVNSQTEKLFGYKRRELLGHPVDILVPKSIRKRHPGLHGDFFAAPQARPMGAGRDLHAQRKDGTEFAVEIRLNPIETEEGTCVLSSILDITDRKRAEATLRESEERFRKLADTAPVMIWVSGPDKLCTFFNMVWLEFRGRTMEQELGNGWAEGVHPDDVDCCIATYSASFDARRRFRMEYRLRRADGEYRWILDDGVPCFSGDGIFVGYIGSCVDITENKRAGEVLQESQKELRALAGRLLLAQEEERNRIARDLHDDLNQTIALLAFDATSLALTPAPLPDEVRKSMYNLKTRIAELAMDVRHIAHQLHPSILEDLGLAPALRELCEGFSARNKIQAVFKQKEMPETLPMDVASCLYRLGQEALHNVLKHARASQVRMTLSGSRENVRLSIQDDGIGFGARSSGPGLGIVSMRERVRLVQGDFSLHSKRSEGTTLTVVIPLLWGQVETDTHTDSG